MSKKDKNKQKSELKTDEIKRLSDFFSLLIQIDKRVGVSTNYEKQDK